MRDTVFISFLVLWWAWHVQQDQLGILGLLHHHFVESHGCVHPPHIRLVAVWRQQQEEAASVSVTELGCDHLIFVYTFTQTHSDVIYVQTERLTDSPTPWKQEKRTSYPTILKRWSTFQYINNCTTNSEVNSRLHIEHVFDSHAFPLPVPLLGQLVFGPSHVDAVLETGSRTSVICCRVGRSVSVVDQLSLKQRDDERRENGWEIMLWRWQRWWWWWFTVRAEDAMKEHKTDLFISVNYGISYHHWMDGSMDGWPAGRLVEWKDGC